MFRHPVLAPSAYLNLYAAGAADEWSADEGRRDLSLIRKIIADGLRPASVLDVGCGAGEFLSTLPAESARYGIEPSAAAAGTAKERGISILAPTLQHLSARMSFAVITLIDVIEHVADPGELLDQAVAHLSPGGTLIVSTGDAETLLWHRLFRSRFWYASYPEHLTFPSSRYFRIWHEGKGLEAPKFLRFKYRRLPAWLTALHFGSQIGYLMNPRLFNCLRRGIDSMRNAARPRRRFFSPGAAGVFADHQIVTFRRMR